MRALDALVAERIEGLTLCSDEYHECPTGRGVRVRNARYSTDMNAALEALEKSDWGIVVEHGCAGCLWYVALFPQMVRVATAKAAHERLPTAICLALLRAAGVCEDEIAKAMEDGS